MKETLGYFLIVSVFAGVFYMQYKQMGLKLTLKVWRDCILIMGILTLGAFLAWGS